MDKIRVAIAGIGNCASSLIQGIEYYRTRNTSQWQGLMHESIGGWSASDIRVVAAFDIDRRQVGHPLEEAVFAEPNCARVFQSVLPPSGVTVQMGPVLDGVAEHMAQYGEDEAFRPADESPVDVAAALRSARAEVLICYLPVGSELAIRHYAQACLDAGVAMVNCVPVFLASDTEWANRFQSAGLPIISDDIKSQVGATIVHRMLGRLFADRGVKADRNRHFAEISPVYRSVRTTDREPVERIARELHGLVRPKGADIGCGAGRYVLSMFEMIPNLSLACVDASPAMLEQVDGLLRANGIDEYEPRRSTAECLELEPGGYDFVSSFNAVHHFDFPEFLRRSRDGLAAGGRLFVYSRLPEHNARSIWGRYFPGFEEKETRLLTLGDLHGAIENTPGLWFAGAACLRYHRQVTLDRLIEQARSRHYSTFSLYESDAFEDALGPSERSSNVALPIRSNGTTRTYSSTQCVTTADLMCIGVRLDAH